MAERTNEEQLDLFADLLEPCATIMADKEFTDALSDGSQLVRAVRLAIKNHKPQIIEILAALDGVDPDEYKVPNPIGLFKKIFDILKRDEVQELFTGQARTIGGASSGSATETIKDGAE